jgi:hypothetical protein
LLVFCRGHTVIIEISDLFDDRDEETGSVLVMREHAKAPCKLFEYLRGIECREHGLLEAALSLVLLRNVYKPAELLEVVPFLCGNTGRLEFLSENVPACEALAETEAWQIHPFKLQTLCEMLEGRRNHRLVLDWVEGAGGVGYLAAYSQ